ncbi:hypothetical protein PspLS_12146 [Pyricularia sp. CBS 133598]|nr:hypothetical protein PspLS_12146 [Pyricularia sp. CBS 133598]
MVDNWAGDADKGTMGAWSNIILLMDVAIIAFSQPFSSVWRRIFNPRKQQTLNGKPDMLSE